MGEFNAEVAYTKLEANVKSNQYRIEDLEKQQNTIQAILLSIEKIATEMKGMKEDQADILSRLKVIEQKPKVTLDIITASAISALVGGGITTLFFR